jgi:integral membrane sensor domain MASE1
VPPWQQPHHMVRSQRLVLMVLPVLLLLSALLSQRR